MVTKDESVLFSLSIYTIIFQKLSQTAVILTFLKITYFLFKIAVNKITLNPLKVKTSDASKQQLRIVESIDVEKIPNRFINKKVIHREACKCQRNFIKPYGSFPLLRAYKT